MTAQQPHHAQEFHHRLLRYFACVDSDPTPHHTATILGPFAAYVARGGAALCSRDARVAAAQYSGIKYHAAARAHHVYSLYKQTNVEKSGIAYYVGLFIDSHTPIMLTKDNSLCNAYASNIAPEQVPPSKLTCVDASTLAPEDIETLWAAYLGNFSSCKSHFWNFDAKSQNSRASAFKILYKGLPCPASIRYPAAARNNPNNR